VRAERILITGLSSHWGGRLAQRLERDGRWQAIVGIDSADPRHVLERTEFVRVGADEALVRRIVRAAQIDTIVEVRLAAEALGTASEAELERALAATRSLLAAIGGPGSPVRKLVFQSSALVYGAGREDPAFFREEMVRTRPGRGALERALVTAEELMAEFRAANPQVTVTLLRCAPAIGAEVRSPHLALLSLPIVPAILGFDPRWQFIHEEDLLGALAHAAAHELPGAYNAAADGVLALSEVASLLGKTLVPLLPPWGTVFAAVQLRRLGLGVPVELLRDLRHGRGLDNRRLKAAGYRYRYTSREAVIELRSHQRLRPLLAAGGPSYRYEREVEEFLRWSPHVQAVGSDGPADRLGPSAGAPGEDGEPTVEELLELIPSLEPDAIRLLREHEAAAGARAQVLAALDHQLGLRGAS